MTITIRGSQVFIVDDIRNQLAAILLTADGAMLMGADADYTRGFKAAITIVAASLGIQPYELERRQQ